MLLLQGIALPAQAANSCTAGFPNANVIESTPTSDFTINADGTVTHLKTGLIWKRCAEGQSWNGLTCFGNATTSGWHESLQAATTATFAGFNDWRLPNKKELESVVEDCGYSPAINQVAFPAAPVSGLFVPIYFWSGSPNGSSDAWAVDFAFGRTDTIQRGAGYFARLVRGGQSVDSFDLLRPYSVIYDGNSNTGGIVPIDARAYATGETVPVSGNTGNLIRTGYTFTGWNTAADGSGTTYVGGSTFVMGTGNVTLYAKWTLNNFTVVTVTVNKAGSGSGTVTSSPGTINCGATCSDNFAPDTAIVLTATPTVGSLFAGWLGPCTGTGTCQFTVNGLNSTASVSATFAPVANGTHVLDIDGNGSYDALTDGLLIIRYLLGSSGSSLTNGATGTSATRISPAQINGYLIDVTPELDIDGNNQVDAMTDGLLIIRYMFGLRGAALIAGAVGAAPTRSTAAAIETQLQTLMP